MTEKDIHEYKKSIEEKTKEELLELEKEVVDEAEKLDQKIAKMEFDMPTENYEIVAEAVRYFLNKQSIQWQYTLAMVGMYDFWDPKKHPKKIPYAQLDTILRTLGGLQFTGYEEWVKVVIVNKFFEGLREDYVNTTQEVYDIATKHNAIIERLDLLVPQNDKN